MSESTLTTTDLTNHDDSAENVAQAIADHLSDRFDVDVFVREPGDSRQFGRGDFYQIVCEGPLEYEWTVKLTGQYEYYGLEGIHDMDGFYFEPYNHIALDVVPTQ